MKFIHKISVSQLLTLIALVVIGFSACTEDKVVVPKTLEQYKSELSEIVASEKVIVQNCVVGYNKGDFKSMTNYPEYTGDYLAALLEAEAILGKPDLTIADVMDANYLISDPGDYFNDNIWISDRRPLDEVVIYCDTLRVHTPIGTEVGSAPQEAHDQFNASINVAKGVRSRSTTIERQVTEAVDELNLELEIFEEAIVK